MNVSVDVEEKLVPLYSHCHRLNEVETPSRSHCVKAGLMSAGTMGIPIVRLKYECCVEIVDGFLVNFIPRNLQNF